MIRSLTITAITLCVLLSSGCNSNAVNGGWNVYGQDPMGPGDAVAIGALSGSEHDVVIHGVIHEVCLVKGCWMTLQDDDGRQIFVKFRDYSFFVPRNAQGRRAVIRGHVVMKDMSVEELRHYAEDVHRSAEEIEAITRPESRMTFYADSVMIEGRGLQKPYVSRPGDECY